MVSSVWCIYNIYIPLAIRTKYINIYTFVLYHGCFAKQSSQATAGINAVCIIPHAEFVSRYLYIYIHIKVARCLAHCCCAAHRIAFASVFDNYENPTTMCGCVRVSFADGWHTTAVSTWLKLSKAPYKAHKVYSDIHYLNARIAARARKRQQLPLAMNTFVYSECARKHLRAQVWRFAYSYHKHSIARHTNGYDGNYIYILHTFADAAFVTRA